MFKKSLCLLLSLLLSVSICACARETAPTDTAAGTTAAAWQTTAATQPADTDEAAEAQTGDTDRKESSTQKSDTGSKKKDSGKKKDSASQSTTKAQTTTKKQESTKKEKSVVSVTLGIDCSQAVGKVDGVPSSGVMIGSYAMSFANAATVYDALCKACDANGVSITATNTMYGLYISAIGGLAEKQAGAMSGWTYTVNGTYPPHTCEAHKLEDGDVIQFIYKAG